MPHKRHDRTLNNRRIARTRDVPDFAQLASLDIERVADDGDVVSDVRRVFEGLDVGADGGFDVARGGGAIWVV